MLAESACKLLASAVPDRFRGKTGGRCSWLYSSDTLIVLFVVVDVVLEALKKLLVKIGATTVLVGNGEVFPSFTVVLVFIPSSHGSDGDFLLWLEPLFGDEVMLFWPSLAN